MNISRITVLRESLKKEDAYYYDGFHKYTEPKTIEGLDRILAAVLYDIATNQKQEDEYGVGKSD